MRAPKCRVCGVREANHECRGVGVGDEAPPRRWSHQDMDAAGEPVEVAETVRRKARFYAPPGECAYCDRRRRAAAKTMRAIRERGDGYA